MTHPRNIVPAHRQRATETSVASAADPDKVLKGRRGRRAPAKADPDKALVDQLKADGS